MPSLTLNQTMDRLLLLIRAGYPVIYIVSHEEARVLDYLARIMRVVKRESRGKHFLRWYEGIGLEEFMPEALTAWDDTNPDWLSVGGLPSQGKWQPLKSESSSEALNSIKRATLEGHPALGDSLTVIFDIHQNLRGDAAFGGLQPLIRPLRTAADELRKYYNKHRRQPGRPYKTIIIVAPSSVGLSQELERDLIVVDFPLPETNELLQTLNSYVEQGRLSFPLKFPAEQARELCDPEATEEIYRKRLCDLIAGAGRGLTLEDYKLGLNMFAVRGETLNARHIEDMLDLKAKGISHNQSLMYTPHVDLKLGGLANVKEWVKKRRDPIISTDIRERFHLPPPKGAMLCGVSGGGKSQLAKYIAKELNLALLRLDVGALFGMYVGESEQRTRDALQLAEVLAPVVLWLDEVDKAFTGVGAAGDNGVSARVFGHFLTWLAEKQDSVFVVTTANDFRALLTSFPEFGRKGRFDEIFWVDLPDRPEREGIFNIYLTRLREGNYIYVTDEAVRSLRERNNIYEEPSAADPFKQFCQLLSHPTISNNMTGAEIEYAVTDSLYEAYGRGSEFTPDIVVETVKKAMNRALYNPNSPDFATLGALRQQAHGKNWLLAGQVDWSAASQEGEQDRGQSYE